LTNGTNYRIIVILIRHTRVQGNDNIRNK
jgi:hypothetical protein